MKRSPIVASPDPSLYLGGKNIETPLTNEGRSAGERIKAGDFWVTRDGWVYLASHVESAGPIKWDITWWSQIPWALREELSEWNNRAAQACVDNELRMRGRS